ncbi:hypothetical protein KC460_04560 [Candidatus Dependentiae bacterium]|nr:hypothetical protein [Candidatus Dependentiae bacterium]
MDKKYIALLVVSFIFSVVHAQVQKRFAIKAVCAPEKTTLTASQAQKLLPGSQIAGKSFELVNPQTNKKRTCFLLIQQHKDATQEQAKQASQQIDSALNPAFDIGVNMESLDI